MVLNINADGVDDDGSGTSGTQIVALIWNRLINYAKSHASEHITGGEQAIPVATAAATGLCPVLSEAATDYLDGTGAFSVPSVAAAAHASDHVTGGADVIPAATTIATGLCPVIPDDATYYLDGTGTFSVPPGSAGSNVPIMLYPIGAIIPSTESDMAGVTEETNGPMYVYLRFTEAATTRRVQWFVILPSNVNYNATMVFTIYWKAVTLPAIGVTGIKIYGYRFEQGDTLDHALTLLTSVSPSCAGVTPVITSTAPVVVPAAGSGTPGRIMVIELQRTVVDSIGDIDILAVQIMPTFV